MVYTVPKEDVMAGPRTAPCNWPLIYCNSSDASSEVGCPHLAALTPDMQEVIESMATAYLWNWTKQMFGTCPVTIRPCRDDCGYGWGTTYRGRSNYNYLPWTEGNPGPLSPALFNGQWYNLGCGGACNNDPCSCSYVATVDLMGPVDSIVSVRINGELLAPSAYRIDNFRYLVRTDGGDWPVCQNMTADPLTDDDTFEVTYNIGVAVPAGGQLAAGILACEYAKYACNDDTCQLPQRLQTINRQGVHSVILDTYDTMYAKGTTGLWIVDSWVASVTNNQAKAGFRVASPDRRFTRRTTG